MKQYKMTGFSTDGEKLEWYANRHPDFNGFCSPKQIWRSSVKIEGIKDVEDVPFTVVQQIALLSIPVVVLLLIVLAVWSVIR